MVLGKLPVPGRPTIWIIVGQGLTALAVGAGGGCLDIFTLVYLYSSVSPSLWETARYRLKYCLKGPLSPKQPTNQLWSKLDFLNLNQTRYLLYKKYICSNCEVYESKSYDGGWMTCDFTSFSTVFQSYQDDGRMIMKGCVQWNPVYG